MAISPRKQVKNEKTALPRTVRKQVTAYTVSSILLLVIAIVCIVVRGSIADKVTERKQEEAWYQESLQKVEQIQSMVARKEELVKQNGASISSPIMEATDFYSYVTSAAEKFHLTIGYVRNGAAENDNGVHSQHYLMSFSGTAADLKLMLDSLETLPSPYSIESISYRVKTDSEWITRAIDSETTYEWFVAAANGVTNGDNLAEISLSDMLDYEEYTLFLDLAFVSTF